VNLFPATRSTRKALRMLGPDGQPLSRKYYSEKTENDLDADEMVRGYEYDKDKFVVLTDEELERLAPGKSRDIDLTRFVKAETIPPIHFERGYFLTPAANSEKAYKLLVEAMAETGQAGIATFVMRGKEHLLAIFSDHAVLRAETMRFPDELRSPKDVGLPAKKMNTTAVKKFETLISKRSRTKFTPVKDVATEQLLKLVKKRQSKRANVVKVETEEPSRENVVDMMEILKRSLSGKRPASARRARG
jgi:DNA end-binding protein Ku